MIRTDVLGVVLTGGRSSRMGRDKAALPHPHGGTFADHAIGRLQCLCRDVAVAGGDPTPGTSACWTSVNVIPDPAAHLGPVTGIAAAMSQCAPISTGAVLVTPVDMPYLTSDELHSLLEAWEGTRDDHPPQPMVATFDGLQREPLVAVYPVALLASLKHLAASGDRSLNRWLQLQPHRLHRLSPEAAANINTPGQYRELIREGEIGESLTRPRKRSDR